MAEKDNQSRGAFPRIPPKNWWDLRERALQRVPSKITADYLCQVLGIGEGAAGNLMPNLRHLGLIDEHGQTTNAFEDWRHDDDYPKFCQKTRETIYPDELLSAEPPPSPNIEKVVSWFSRNRRVGAAAARQMAATYVLLCNADATQAKVDKSRISGRAKDAPPLARKTGKKKVTTPGPRVKRTRNGSGDGSLVPSIQFNLQVHISPEATGEQIDHIFSSIAKHLRKIGSA